LGFINLRRRGFFFPPPPQTPPGGGGGAPHLLSIQQREQFTLRKSVLLTQTSNLLKVKKDWALAEDQGIFSSVGLNVTPPYIYIVLLIKLQFLLGIILKNICHKWK